MSDSTQSGNHVSRFLRKSYCWLPISLVGICCLVSLGVVYWTFLFIPKAPIPPETIVTGERQNSGASCCLIYFETYESSLKNTEVVQFYEASGASCRESEVEPAAVQCYGNTFLGRGDYSALISSKDSGSRISIRVSWYAP
jgi:hypothetical protein